jgi:hypothetical protein
VKPSERFSELKTAAEALEEGQDKSDLLALFQMADALHRKVECFGLAVGGVKNMIRSQNKHFEIMTEWLEKWKPMLESFEYKRTKEKIVPFTRTRESDIIT